MAELSDFKQRVLAAVAKHGAATTETVISEVRRAESRTGVALRALADGGLLVRIYEGRSKSGVGRKPVFYYLSHQGLAYLIEIGALPEGS